MPESSPSETYLSRLRTKLSLELPAIRKAAERTVVTRRELEQTLQKPMPSDTALVMFGSVARAEMTSGSDLDWILLVDGSASPQHKRQEQEMLNLLREKEFVEPGTSGVLGKMVSSHDLVNKIGGEDDLNSNTTRRVLLLLESLPIGNREAFDRVRRHCFATWKTIEACCTVTAPSDFRVFF